MLRRTLPVCLPSLTLAATFSLALFPREPIPPLQTEITDAVLSFTQRGYIESPLLVYRYYTFPGFDDPISPAPPVNWQKPTAILITDAPTAQVHLAYRHVAVPHMPPEIPNPYWWPGRPNTNVPPGDERVFPILMCRVPDSPFGVRTRTIRGRVTHPNGGDIDLYIAGVSTFLGTFPGVSLTPRFVVHHAALGMHTEWFPDPSGIQPFACGGSLAPPSGVPAPLTADYPAGMALCAINPQTNMITVDVTADSVPFGSISSIELRHTVAGPLLEELRPFMSEHIVGAHATSLRCQNHPVSPATTAALHSGTVALIVGFSGSIHPDGKIVGTLAIATCTADLNGDDLVDDADFVQFAGAYELLLCSDPPMPDGCPADLNGDDHVDDADFVIFATAYNDLFCP